MRTDIHQYIDEERLRNDITQNGEFGKVPVESGHARTVIPGTEANREAREYFVERLRDAGLEVRVDGVGNIAGRWVPEGTDPDTRPVASGSHLDSVPMGGIFDGVLGVYGALEAVRAIQESDVTPTRPLEVVCFTEEEGSRFSDGVLGSSVASHERSVEAARALTDEDGVTLAAALDNIGFSGEGMLDASEWDSWLELHVEQSERLEAADVPVGIVSSITGTIRCRIEIIGEANHSGSTAMHDRQDALAAASELVLAVEEATNDAVEQYGETVVGTVGKLDVEPNAINVVPGRVELGVDVRDVNYKAMVDIINRIRQTLEQLSRSRHVETTFERPYDIEPIAMADNCISALSDAADAAGVEKKDLHSGAGHDTMHVAKVTDAGMLFAPSEDGVSHSPHEWTDWDDCAATTAVLAGGLALLASE